MSGARWITSWIEARAGLCHVQSQHCREDLAVGLKYADAIRQVKEQADIVAVVGRSVALQKNGARFKGLCPFHGEKTPSFHVNPAMNAYYCFGCHASGSVIDFTMKIERLTFDEALRKLAGELGIAIEEDRRTPEERDAREAAEKQNRALLAANEFAANWFRRNLLDGRNAVASAYLERRGISPEIAERFRLGASLDGWDNLLLAARKEGYSPELLTTAGLVAPRTSGSGHYDRFRNRLIFPICDAQGRVVAFGARLLDDAAKEAKYLNTTETPLFHKSHTVYGLHLAQKTITTTGAVLLMEGYVDVIMAHQYGFDNAVASLGTALTNDHGKLLKRYATKAFFVYDGDAPGQKAMREKGIVLLREGLDVRVVVLPPEHDPDTFLKENGPEALRERMAAAPEYFDVMLAHYEMQHDLRTLVGQGRLIEEAGALVRALPKEEQREIALQRVMSRVPQLPRAAIELQLRKPERRAPTPAAEPAPSSVPAKPRHDPLERFLLLLMLRSPAALERVRERLSESWLVDTSLESLILYFISGRGTCAQMMADAEATNEPPPNIELVHQLAVEEVPLDDPLHATDQLLARLELRNQQRIITDLIRAVQATMTSDPASIPTRLLVTLHAERERLMRQRVPSVQPTGPG